MESSSNTIKSVSILICSKDRRDDLEKLIPNLIEIKTTHSFEIIVIEETEWPKHIEGTNYISHPVRNRGIAYARNLALKNAKGDIIIFLDDDCQITDGWFTNILAPFKDDNIIGIQGGVSVPKSTNFIGWAETIIGFPGGGLKRVIKANGISQKTREISTLNCAYRKCVFDKLGGFDEALNLGSEDYLLAKQVQAYGSCLFIPNAIAYHKARANVFKILKWFIRRGRAEIDLIKSRKQKDTTFYSIIKSSILMKIFLLLAIGLLFINWAPMFFTITILFFFSLQYYRHYAIWVKSNSSIASFLVIPVIKLVMDIGTDLGRLREILFA